MVHEASFSSIPPLPLKRTTEFPLCPMTFSIPQACVQSPVRLLCPILVIEAGSLVFPLQLLRPVYQEDAIPEGEMSTVLSPLSLGRQLRLGAQLPALSSEAFLIELG